MENLVEKLWKACGKADGNVNNCKHLLVLAFLTDFWVRAFFCYAGYSNVSPWVMCLWSSAFEWLVAGVSQSCDYAHLQ